MYISSIAALTVPVSDQDRALAFYSDVLGFEVRSDNPFPHGRWLTVAPKGCETTLLLASWFPGKQPLGGTVLHTSDIDGLAARLRDNGVDLEGPTDEPWGRQLLFHDPFGNGYAVTQT